MSKFLVLWSLEPALLGAAAVKSVFAMPEYATRLMSEGKLEKRYHLIGKHGGAWIYDVVDNNELDRCLALAPVYNFARYEIHALAEMKDPKPVAEDLESGKKGK